MKLDMSVQRQEPRLRQRRDLRNIFHIQHKQPGALAMIIGEVSRFRLLLIYDLLDYGAELSSSREMVGTFGVQDCFQEKTNESASNATGIKFKIRASILLSRVARYTSCISFAAIAQCAVVLTFLGARNVRADPKG